MERITKRRGGAICYTGKYTRVPELETADTMRVAAIRDVMQRLADYEDTGLTPEQIERPTCEGYDVEQLRALAEVLKAQDIQAGELRQFCDNVQTAMEQALAPVIEWVGRVIEQCSALIANIATTANAENRGG